MLEADPWNLLIVDEAHHLNAEEQHGFTLGYRLVRGLNNNGLIESMVFFTGTPHRGKNYGFIALLSLLRPDLFDLQKPMSLQMSSLSRVMIRNNKSTVTDLEGNRLFRRPKVKIPNPTFPTSTKHYYLSNFIQFESFFCFLVYQ